MTAIAEAGKEATDVVTVTAVHQKMVAVDLQTVIGAMIAIGTVREPKNP